MSQNDRGPNNHIIVYDMSGSTMNCEIQIKNGNRTRTVSYYDYLRKEWLTRLQRKYKNVQFHYIAWSHYAIALPSIFELSEGGTDPSEAFEIIFKEHGSTMNHIHLVTDGDICNFDYRKLDSLKATDKLDIYYFGNSNHNIEFYQNVKKRLGTRCNVYVNTDTIKIYENIVNGALEIPDDEETTLLNYDFSPAKFCQPFDKLIASVATYGKDPVYKKAIQKTLRNLIKKSKGNVENKKLPDNIRMDELKKLLKTRREEKLTNFDKVVSFLMKKLNDGNFNSGSLSGRIFLTSLNTDEEFQKITKLEMDQATDENDGEGEEVEEETVDEEKETDIIVKLTCAISMEDIKGIYMMEASLNDKIISENTLARHVNKIRQYPWNIFHHLTGQAFQQNVTVTMTPYSLESFFGLNQSTRPDQSFFATLYKFSKLSFVLMHKDMNIRVNDIQIVINLNYMWACFLFFQTDAKKLDFAVGKKFEIVYIYLLFLRDYFESKHVDLIYLKDVDFTLQALMADSKSLCKMPQHPIYYSMKLYKRILGESSILESISKPAVKHLIIRKWLKLDNQILTDNLILFVGCLMWMNLGKCPDIFKKHSLLDQDKFKEILGIPVPTRKLDVSEILRFLLKQFVKTAEFKSNFIFLDELKREQDFYFDKVPINFLKFLIPRINHSKIPLQDTKKRNIDLNLINLYLENHNYLADFDEMLTGICWNRNAKLDIDVCWSTLRPNCRLEQEKVGAWKKYTKYYHLSPHKMYLKCYQKRGGAFNKEEFFGFLAENFRFKTFSPNFEQEFEEISQVYQKIFTEHYKNNADQIKSIIEITWDLSSCKRMEENCNIPQCFHARGKSVETTQNFN